LVLSSCYSFNSYINSQKRDANLTITYSNVDKEQTNNRIPSSISKQEFKKFFILGYSIKDKNDKSNRRVTNRPVHLIDQSDYEIVELIPDNKYGKLEAKIRIKQFNGIFNVVIQYNLLNQQTVNLNQKLKNKTEATYTLEQARTLALNDPDAYIRNNKYYQELKAHAINYFNSNQVNQYWSQTYTNRIGYGSDLAQSNSQRVNDFNKVAYDEQNVFHIQNPKILDKEIKTVKEYVPKGSNNTYWIDRALIHELIKINPYGYLPTAFAQFINTIKKEEYYKFINITNDKKTIINNSKDKLNEIEIVEILYRMTDRHGELEFIIKIKDLKTNQFVHLSEEFNTTNSSLKRNEDYWKFIYDRSISINFLSTKDGKEAHINSGTGWIVDRIKDDSIDPDYVKVLVATNLHVLSFSNFTKTKKEDERTRWFSKEEYEQYLKKNKYQLVSDTYLDKERYKYVLWSTAAYKPDISNFYSSLAGVSSASLAKVYNLNQDNWLDRTWFIPSIQANGVITNDNLATYIKTKNGIKTLANGTMDLIIVPMLLKKEDIKKRLPAYYDVLDTKNEADWYIGLGNNKPYLPQLQTFRAGYPGDHRFSSNALTFFMGSKAYGGLVQGFDREITSGTIIDYLGVKKINNKDGVADLNNTYLHKMFNVGSRLISSEEIGQLGAGSSGSLVIDARFNPIGIHFASLLSKSYGTENNTQIANLFVAQSPDLIGDVNLGVALRNKLKKDRIYTYKINPKTE
ncbi:MAG2960 family serine endopeptidase lipoprotein, partial [Ureaplasma diversum]|uniref:MAG2960 family serine endopeptidase lipoprotein n=1 Tax=Ureaplasma diversum TaxID=42094 RepID=UPI000571FF52